LSTTTLPLPSGFKEIVAVAFAGQLRFNVVLPSVTKLLNVALGFEVATLIGSNSRIAPKAPVKATLKLLSPPVEKLRVALSKTPAVALGVNVTLIAHEPGAAIGLAQVFVSMKSLGPVVVALTTVIPILLTVTDPLPLTLMVTACGALVVLKVGTPNDKDLLLGETVTVCALADRAPIPIEQHVAAINAIRRTFNSDIFITASLRRQQKMYRQSSSAGASIMGRAI
jgi:hypothetical protein